MALSTCIMVTGPNHLDRAAAAPQFANRPNLNRLALDLDEVKKDP